MGQSVNTIRIPVTTTGVDGSGVGEASSAGVRAAIMSFYIKYHASAPGTTDVVITEVGGAGRTLLTRNNTNTSGEFPVRISEVGNTGTAGSGVTPYFLGGEQIKVAVTGANALAPAVEVFAYVLQ